MPPFKFVASIRNCPEFQLNNKVVVRKPQSLAACPKAEQQQKNWSLCGTCSQLRLRAYIYKREFRTVPNSSRASLFITKKCL